MEAKEAVLRAKKHLIHVYEGEDIAAPTLEEVWFEPAKKIWFVTLGVRRIAMSQGSVADRLGLASLPDYKVVRISDTDGKALSVRDRVSDAFAK